MNEDQSKLKHFLVDSKFIEKITKDKKLIFRKFFGLTTAENTIVKKEGLNKYEQFYLSIQNELQSIQRLFLLKINIFLITKLEKNEDEKKIAQINENIKYILDIDDMFNGLDDIQNKNLEEIILFFIKKIINEKNFIQAKNSWINLGLNLENFNITDRMKKELFIFFLENEERKKYFEYINF